VSAGSIEDVDVIALAFEFVLAFAIWTSYFEDIPQAGLRRRMLPAWLGLHLLLQVSIAGTAIGVARLVAATPLEHLPASEILEITATLAGVYLALGLLGPCSRRIPVTPLLVLRLSTCVAAIVVGIAAWLVPWIDLVEGVAALTVVAVAHATLGIFLEADTRVMDTV